MHKELRHHFDNLHSSNADQRYSSFRYIISETKEPVDWALLYRLSE